MPQAGDSLVPDIFHANSFMAQCGGIGVLELNKLEVELCWQLQWRLMPSAQQLHMFRASLDDLNSGYWDVWSNMASRRTVSLPKNASETAKSEDAKGSAEIGVYVNTPELEYEPEMCKTDMKDRMPRARSWQNHLGRLLFGPGSRGDEPQPTGEVAVVEGEAKQAPEERRGSSGSGSPRVEPPGSPRSVFRRIFSEHVFSVS